MIQNLIKKILGKWVAVVECFPLVSLAVIVILTLGASHYTQKHFSINSDLDRLIKPTKVIPWYQDDREHRSEFPEYQQKALVVISSPSAEKSWIAAEKLYKALSASGKFADVFAPAFDDFARQHALYGAPTEGVRYVAEAVQGNLPAMARVYREPSVANFMANMQDSFVKSADMEVLTPESRHQFEVLVSALNTTGQAGQVPSLAMVKPLMPQDDGKTSYQFISVKDFQDFSQDFPYKIAINKIRKVISSVELDDEVQVRITGEVALANDEISEGMSGVQLSGSISLVLLAIILIGGIGYGWHALVLNAGMFLMLFIGITWTTFFALLAVHSFNTLSLIFLVMFFGLGVDFAIHYTLCLEDHVYNRKSPGVSAAVAAAQDVGIPLLLCVMTTVIGFLSFLPTAYVGLAELGIVSAIGMAMAFTITLTFLPAWYKLFGITTGKLQPRRLTGIGERFGHFFSDKLNFSPRTILFITIMLAVTAVWYARDVRFNYSHLAMRDKQTEAMTTLAEIQSQGTVTDYSIAVITEPGKDLQAFKQALLAMPSVARVELPEDNIPLFQDIKYQYMQPVAQQLSALGEPGQIPTLDAAATRAALEQFVQVVRERKEVFLDEDRVLADQLEKALDHVLAQPQAWPGLQQAVADGITADIVMLTSWFAAKPFTLEDLPPKVKAWFMTEDGRQLVSVIPALDMSDIRQMDQFIAEVDSIAPNIAGRTVVEWGVGNMVIEAFQQAALITFFAIFILLWLNFRHIVTVILVFLPLVLSAIFTFAIMKFSGLTLNMANILVVPLIFGLGVDMGIHVVDRYHKCHNVEDLVVSYTTRAIVLSALTTVATFAALSISPHKGAASIGQLLSIALVLLLLLTYTVLPALLAIFGAKKIELIR